MRRKRLIVVATLAVSTWFVAAPRLRAAVTTLRGIAIDEPLEGPALLADALGLTAIHVNRVLRQLREQGLITLKAHHVVIDDVKGLKKLAGFDNAYLDQPRPWAKIED